MKKFLALLLTIALMLTSCIALISCNGNGDTPGDNDDKKESYSKLDPTELFKKVVSDTITTSTDAAFSVYEKIFSALENTMTGNLSGTAVSGTVGVEVSPLLISSILPGLSINKIAAEYDVNFAPDSGVAADLALSCGDIELGKAEIYFDKATNDAYIALPGLADGTLKINLEEVLSSADIPSEMPIDQFSSLKLVKYISAVKDYLPKTLNLALDKITAVEKTEETVTANGVSSEAIVLTTNITATIARDIIVAVMDDLMTSEDIKTLIKDFYNDNAAILGFDYYESADELYAEFISTLEEAKADIPEEFTDDEEAITLKTYLNSEYVLTGLEIKVPDDAFNYSVIYAENENEIGEEIKISGDGVEVMNAVLKGTKTDGKFSGTMTVNSEGSEILTIAFENVDYENINDGNFSGKFTVIPGAGLADSVDSLIDPSSMKLVIDIKEASDNKFALELSLLMAGFDVNNGDTTLATLSITNEKDEPTDITFPQDAVTDPDAWAMTIDTEELMSRLNSIGITEDVLAGFMY